MSPADARGLAEAAALYSGDLLTTLDRDWCLLLREKLRAKYTALLDRIMRFEMAHDAWQKALGWAEKLLAVDPLLEHAHRAVMQCQFLMGNRGAVIRQYTSCAAMLQH